MSSVSLIVRVRAAVCGLFLLLAAAPAAAQGSYAFENVSILPMDRDNVLAGQTVVVREGRIVEVAPSARVTLPPAAIRIDGRGKFLMPGLAEMHAHVLGGNAPAQLNHDIFFLYIANGITTIRGMLGAPNQLALRDSLERHEILGPAFYVGAPSLNGQSAPDPETGARLVREHKAAGYDFLKIHPGLSRETYDAIASTAQEAGITWAGHVPSLVGLRRALAAGQSTIDHLDGYLEASIPDSARTRLESANAPLGDHIRAMDPSRFHELAQLSKSMGVWNVPTMFLWESFFTPESPDAWTTRAELRYATPQWRTQWMNQKRQRMSFDAQNQVTPELAERTIVLRRQMLKALADAGAPLLMGTDSPQMFNVPGFALHREIAVMRAAGLTPFQILESGTRNVGRYVGEALKQDGRFGMVAAGHRADLVLLDANPLQDLSALRQIAGVMVRGRWVSASEIERGLAEIERRMR